MSQTCRFGQYEGFHNYHRINYLRKLCVTIHWKSFVSKFDGLASEHVKGWDGWWGWREGGGQRGSTGGQAPGRPLARRRRGASDVSRQSDAIGSTVRTRHRFCACDARSTFPCPPPLSVQVLHRARTCFVADNNSKKELIAATTDTPTSRRGGQLEKNKFIFFRFE